MSGQNGAAPGIITIDGPAASGKSSVAREVARRLGIPFVSSGLLYRGAGWIMLQSELTNASEEETLTELARHEVSLVPGLQGNLLLIDGTSRYAELHTDEIDRHVSRVAGFSRVRDWVNTQIQQLDGSFVIEGRDMGSAVFPQAAHKFYLNAPVELRARRRLSERQADLAALTEQLARRDHLDARQLRPAADAQLIDTARLDVAGVADVIIGRIQGD